MTEQQKIWIAAGAVLAGFVLLSRSADQEYDEDGFPVTPSTGPAPPRKRPKKKGARADQCNPVDATTWPAGKVCAHDGERFVLVDASGPGPDPTPATVTDCAIEIDDDHSGIGSGHKGVSASELQKLNAAVVMGKGSVTLHLKEGSTNVYWTFHDHAVTFNASKIKALRSGEWVSAWTTDDGTDHNHLVWVQCTRA